MILIPRKRSLPPPFRPPLTIELPHHSLIGHNVCEACSFQSPSRRKETSSSSPRSQPSTRKYTGSPPTFVSHRSEVLKPRYDHGSDIVKITSRRKRTLVSPFFSPSSSSHAQLENRGWVIKYFREAMAEAWKADLNFIPPPDTFIAPIQLAPHLMLAFEERLAAAKEEQEFRDSFDRVKEQAEKGYTLFRLYDNAIESAEQRIPSKMQVRAHRKFLEATERGTKFELALNGPVTADLMVVDNLPEACTPARLMTLFSSFSPRGAIVRVRKQHVIGILEFHSQEQRDVAVRDAPALVSPLFFFFFFTLSLADSM